MPQPTKEQIETAAMLIDGRFDVIKFWMVGDGQMLVETTYHKETATGLFDGEGFLIGDWLV